MSIQRIFAVLLTCLLVAVAYRDIDFSLLFGMIADFQFQTVLLVFALYLSSQIVSSLKWGLFLDSAGIHRPRSTVVNAYFAGMCVNSFGLGTLGGDAVRSMALHPQRGQRSAMLGTVVADRLHGLFVLLCIAAISLFFVEEIHGGTLVLLGVLTSAIALFAAWSAIIFFHANRLDWIKFGRLADIVDKISNSFPRSAKVIVQASGISLMVHFLQIAMCIVVARQLGIELSMSYFFAVVPLANIASSLPITIGGVGVREAIYTTWLVPLGVAHEAAVAMGAVCLLVTSIVSAVGGLWYARSLSAQADPNDTLPSAKGSGYLKQQTL